MMNGYKKKLNLVGSRVIDKKKKKKELSNTAAAAILLDLQAGISTEERVNF
jgi:hypothetical protein